MVSLRVQYWEHFHSMFMNDISHFTDKSKLTNHATDTTYLSDEDISPFPRALKEETKIKKSKSLKSFQSEIVN